MADFWDYMNHVAFPVLYPQVITAQPIYENLTFSQLVNCSNANATVITKNLTSNGILCEILNSTSITTWTTPTSGTNFALVAATGFIVDSDAYLIGARLRQVYPYEQNMRQAYLHTIVLVYNRE